MRAEAGLLGALFPVEISGGIVGLVVGPLMVGVRLPDGGWIWDISRVFRFSVP